MQGKKTVEILRRAEAGDRISEEDAVCLLNARGADVWAIAQTADQLREKKVGNVVTYVRNQNLHITNICKNLCGFCSFGRPRGAEGAYRFGKAEVQAEALRAQERGVTEVCFLSGVHPNITAEDYAEMIGWVHEILPEVDLHVGSPDEIASAAEKSKISTRKMLEMCIAAGIGTVQGTAAEILVDSVRDIICPNKIKTAEWIRIIKEAHGLGLKSTSTIMYGTIESSEDIASHLGILREIQDETGGFTELVPLSYLYQNTSLYERGIAPKGATGRRDLLLFAVARIFLDNFDHIQIPWGKVGLKMTQLGLMAGGDDVGGTMFIDAVSTDAGSEEGGFFDPAEMERIASDAGRVLRQRTTRYQLID